MTATLLLLLRLALTAALYAFLGWAIYTLWRELQFQQAALAARLVPPLQLTIQSAEGTRMERYTTPIVSIGRSPQCDCAIDDRTLSAQHARLSYHHNQWWLEDLASTNGTLLHGEPVTTAVVLASGDLINCGKVQIIIEIENHE
jgi:pSer/pThr/pTyr-binding forkhead associated (FHA) protein